MINLYIYFPFVVTLIFVILLTISFHVKSKRYNYRVDVHEIFSNLEMVLIILTPIVMGVIFSLIYIKTI